MVGKVIWEFLRISSKITARPHKNHSKIFVWRRYSSLIAIIPRRQLEFNILPLKRDFITNKGKKARE